MRGERDVSLPHLLYYPNRWHHAFPTSLFFLASTPAVKPQLCHNPIYKKSLPSPLQPPLSTPNTTHTNRNLTTQSKIMCIYSITRYTLCGHTMNKQTPTSNYYHSCPAIRPTNLPTRRRKNSKVLCPGCQEDPILDCEAESSLARRELKSYTCRPGVCAALLDLAWGSSALWVPKEGAGN